MKFFLERKEPSVRIPEWFFEQDHQSQSDESATMVHESEIAIAGKLQSDPCDGNLIAEVKRLVREDGHWPPEDTHSAHVSEARVIETFLYYEDHRQVVEQSGILLKRCSANWRVRWYLAQAHFREGEVQEAQKILDILDQKPLDLKFRQKHPDEMANILQLRWQSLGRSPDNEEDFRNACNKLLHYFPDHYITIDALLSRMDADEKLELYKDLSRRFKQPKSPPITVMTGLLHNHAERLEFHQDLIACFRKRPDSLIRIYTQATEAAEDGHAIWYKLRFYTALALHYQDPQKDRKLQIRKSKSKSKSHRFRRFLKPAMQKPERKKARSLEMWEQDVETFLGLPHKLPEEPEDDNCANIIRTVTSYTAGMLASSYTSMARGERASIQEHVRLLERIKERNAPMTASGRPNHFLDHSLARLHHLDVFHIMTGKVAWC
ncbi:hypothetical protein INS49_015560 [Diaporthe citri]|uniref:uncharacterized protein n=1 Tax=Diaporthe citri TaxID=83186 RepID=UPI001C7E4A3A|nr:uncharacterized protein INS49_015560 [Diaporthe citri]KAG6356173.1 hypothetical protein INS49_015560 [Diaporthe citri]